VDTGCLRLLPRRLIFTKEIVMGLEHTWYNLCHQAGNIAMGFGQGSQLSNDARSTFQQLRNSRVIK
jgi:hypothetical protein